MVSEQRAAIFSEVIYNGLREDHTVNPTERTSMFASLFHALLLSLLSLTAFCKDAASPPSSDGGILGGIGSIPDDILNLLLSPGFQWTLMNVSLPVCFPLPICQVEQNLDGVEQLTSLLHNEAQR